MSPAKVTAHDGCHYEDLMGRTTDRYERRWDSDEAIIYALSVGAGADDPTTELEYTTEGVTAVGQAVLPGFASVLGKPHPDAYALLGPVERTTILQSGYELEWTAPRPLPVAGRIWATTTVTEIFAHPRGSFVTLESRCADPGSDDCAFLTRSKVFVRGLLVAGAPPPPKRAAAPTTEPDLVVAVETSSQQALLHRLLGDRNLLHCDPVVAARSGFDRPILHGLCTLGVAARILGREAGHGRVGQLRRIAARFSAAVLPGEGLILHVWRIPDGGYAFSMAAPGDRVVLADGRFLARRPTGHVRD